MGKTRTAFIGDTKAEDLPAGKAGKPKKHEKKRSLKEERGIRVPGLKGGERVVSVSAELPSEEETAAPPETIVQETKSKKKARTHGKKYLAALVRVDPKKHYPLPEAIEIAREVSISRFPGNLELHLNLTKKGLPGARQGRFEVQLPHSDSIGKKKVEVATEQTIKKLESGQIDFDILLASPSFMSRLVPYAKLLGPRGLMPNPKNGTIVNDPEKARAEFNSGAVALQAEKDFPVLHTVVGKVTDEPKNLIENTEAILLAVGLQNIKKAVLAPTMGPGIKLAVNSS